MNVAYLLSLLGLLLHRPQSVIIFFGGGGGGRGGGGVNLYRLRRKFKISSRLKLISLKNVEESC